jgi:DNA-binding response OmpR family regulator
MPRGKKILIIEDHRESSQWIAAVLRQNGYATFEAGDGTLGVRSARHERPDLILLDIHLPAGSGYFVLESLKKCEDTRQIPVIIMTGDVDLDPVELRQLGAAALFRKPMDVGAFLQTIATVIDNYSRTQLVVPA